MGELALENTMTGHFLRSAHRRAFMAISRPSLSRRTLMAENRQSVEGTSISRSTKIAPLVEILGPRLVFTTPCPITSYRAPAGPRDNLPFMEADGSMRGRKMASNKGSS